MCGLVSSFSTRSYLSIYLPILHCLNYCNYISLEIKQAVFSTLLFFKILLAISIPVSFHLKFRTSIFIKHMLGSLIRPLLKFSINLGVINIVCLVLLNFLTHEHWCIAIYVSPIYQYWVIFSIWVPYILSFIFKS